MNAALDIKEVHGWTRGQPENLIFLMAEPCRCVELEKRVKRLTEALAVTLDALHAQGLQDQGRVRPRLELLPAGPLMSSAAQPLLHAFHAFLARAACSRNPQIDMILPPNQRADFIGGRVVAIGMHEQGDWASMCGADMTRCLLRQATTVCTAVVLLYPTGHAPAEPPATPFPVTLVVEVRNGAPYTFHADMASFDTFVNAVARWATIGASRTPYAPIRASLGLKS